MPRTDLGTRIVHVTDDELTTLITESSSPRVLEVIWGSGAVVISEENRWAIERIAELRGIEFGTSDVGLTCEHTPPICDDMLLDPPFKALRVECPCCHLPGWRTAGDPSALVCSFCDIEVST